MVIFMEAKPSLQVQESEHLPDNSELKIGTTVFEVESFLRETSTTDSAIFPGGSLVSPSSSSFSETGGISMVPGEVSEANSDIMSEAGTCDLNMVDVEEEEPDEEEEEEEEGLLLDAFEDQRVMNKIEVLAKMVGIGESSNLGDVLSEVVRVLKKLEETRKSIFCLDYNTCDKMIKHCSTESHLLG